MENGLLERRTSILRLAWDGAGMEINRLVVVQIAARRVTGHHSVQRHHYLRGAICAALPAI